MTDTVTLVFPHSVDHELQDLVTYAAQVELDLEHNIPCAQTAHNQLVFENSRDQLLALLVLAGKRSYAAQSSV